MRGSGGWRQHPRRKRCAEFSETGLGLRARRVDRADGAPASAGAAQHVVAEGVLMKLGPIRRGRFGFGAGTSECRGLSGGAGVVSCGSGWVTSGRSLELGA